jgi:hypothetical protein
MGSDPGTRPRENRLVRAPPLERIHRQPELVAVWTLIALVGLALFVTYARFPATELYNVSRSGLRGGASRLVVFLGFPVSLIAFAIVPVAYDLAATPRRRPLLALAAFAAIGLCATIAIPGVLKQSDLDAKWANAPAAIGVGLTLLLTLAALANPRAPAAPRWARADTARLVVALVLLACATPWIAAELGVYLPGHVFLTSQIRPFAGEGGHGLGPAVHHGDHHGLSGTELALAAIALSRVIPRMQRTWRRPIAAVYLSLMLVYGLANALQDFWLEQVVKRGWTSSRIPSLLHPSLSFSWLAMLIAAAIVLLLLFRPRRAASRDAIIAT